MNNYRTVVSIFLAGVSLSAFAQGGGLSGGYQNGHQFPVTSAVPFLLINSDARSSGLGEISVASNSNNQPNHLLINPSLIVGREKSWGIKTNYTPWLRALVNDVFLFDQDVNFSVNKKNSLTYAFRFFSLGKIQFSNVQGENAGEFTPTEYVHQLRYGRLLSKHFALGVGVKYIYSNLATGQTVAGVEIKPGKSFAVDLGADYRDEFKISERVSHKLNIGIAVLNFGTKIAYTEDAEKDFIPINLNLGVLNTFKILAGDSSSFLQISLGYQADKLMAPTPSTEDNDSNGIYDFKEKTLFKGAFGSFSDAPGGAKEELREFVHHIGTGVEFVLKRKFLAGSNAGVFLENEEKGNRKYFTWSLTVGCYGFYFDFSKLHPFSNERNPLDGTFKISFGFNMLLGEGPKLRFQD